MSDADEIQGDATRLLAKLQGGDPQAGDELMPIVYEELRRLARRALVGRPAQTLQTTDLVDEAWVRLVRPDSKAWEGRNHFLAIAARAMRAVLVDRARKKGTVKRGGQRVEVELDQVVQDLDERAEGLVVLDEALELLAKVDDTLAKIVELHFFAGMQHTEIAKVLGMSLRSVERGWRDARAWLYARLKQNP